MEKNMHCPYCKAELSGNTQFCPQCGQLVVQIKSTSSNTLSYWSKIEQETAKDDKIRTEEDAARKAQNDHKKIINVGLIALLTVIAILVMFKVFLIPSMHYNTEPSTEAQTETPTEVPTEALTEAPTEEIVQMTEEHPFEQQYWIIFTEGTRNNRVEASTITSSLDADELFIIWNGSLTINNNSGASKCNQYYLDENGKWVKMGSYHRLSDRASNVIASNLNIYDKNGKLLVEKCFYQDLDWDLIEKYR